MSWWARRRLRTRILPPFAPLLVGVLLATLWVGSAAVSGWVERSLRRQFDVTASVFRALLFQDVRGFTAIAERTTPDVLVRVVNRLFTEMVDAVEAERGVTRQLVGDAVNLASRIEGLPREIGTTILISAETVRHPGPGFPLGRRHVMAVRGKTEPVEVVEALAD